MIGTWAQRNPQKDGFASAQSGDCHEADHDDRPLPGLGGQRDLRFARGLLSRSGNETSVWVGGAMGDITNQKFTQRNYGISKINLITKSWTRRREISQLPI